MAIKVGGTTVIDDSRNISNVGTVTATAFSGDGSSLTNISSPVVLQATADGAITDGDPVVLNNDSTVSSAGFSFGPPATISNYTGGSISLRYMQPSDNYGNMMVYDTFSGNNIFVWTNGSNTYVQAVDYSGSTPVFGTAVLFAGKTYGSDVNGCDGFCITYDWRTQQAVVLYSVDGSDRLSARRVSCTGTTVSISAEVTLVDGFRANGISAAYDDGFRCIMWNAKGYLLDGNARFLSGLAGIGTTYLYADYYVINANWGSQYPNIIETLYVPSEAKNICLWKESGTTYVVSYAWNGSGFTNGSISSVSYDGDAGLVYDPDQQQALLFQSNSANILTFSGYNLSRGTNFSLPSGYTFSNGQVTYDTTNDKLLFLVTEQATSDPTLVSASNTGSSITFDPPQVITTSTNLGDSAFVYNPTLNATVAFLPSSSTLYTAKIDTLSTTTNLGEDNFIGFANGSYSDGQTASVLTSGVSTAQSGLTFGSTYFVNEDGTLTTTDTGVQAGKALSTAKLLISSGGGGAGIDYITYDGTNIDFFLNSSNEFRMEPDGDFHADGDVIAYSTTISDPRLKTDIQRIDNALDKVAKLSGYTFTYTSDGKASAGVLSTEVAEVLPSAIKPKKLPLKTGDEDTVYDTVQYDQLHSLFIEAIKELKEEVAELKDKIKE